ncbi:CaiB/BaiF CoA-transferase family protein [Tsukamurella sp. PLM1]|uniref:CaiB/BaiF CoA transferase family protein n=1 Tax=Tsukamurella sp. PLM1 TaxID=2929795 RepID=UPI00206DC2FF|nr:CaiB/BaiF CoA-transferase family protein [Tsukamurella sp. PLM1]BDH55754.1 CoA transferase [Tsukamurella sp. PLM1]
MSSDVQHGVKHAPLEGVTVVTIEQAISAPLATRHLADLGARVIKIETPGSGDSTRHYDSVVGGQLSAHFTWLNHGKESAALDLKSEADLALLHGILASADVFVSNLAPGALGRLSLGPAELAARYPRLIIVDISGYGAGGSYDHKRAYDLLIQSEGGVCVDRHPGHPAKPGVPVADVGTALYTYSTVLAALYDRERTGRGAVIPIAMLDTIAEMMGFAINGVIHAGVEPEPVGLGAPIVAPYSGYATSDGQTAVLGTTNDREWAKLAAMVGRPELADDPRYARNVDRVGARAEVDEVLAGWCARHTLAEIQALADATGIGNARLNTVRDLVEHPQLRERGRWRGVGTPSGPVPALLPPGVATSWSVRSGDVPALGEHTVAIRAEFGSP